MSDGDKKKEDATHIGDAPPMLPKQPAGPPADAGSPEPPAETTRGWAAPPVLPHPPGAPAAAPPVAGMAGASDADDDTTITHPRDTARPRFTLNRMRPPGHSDSVTLEREAYMVGRAPTSDIRLYSPSASREHARVIRRADAWYLVPIEGKAVLANGVAVLAEVQLEHKMRLLLGDDELLVIDRLAPAELPSAAPASPSRARWLIVFVVAAAAAIAAAAVWVLSRG